MSADDTSRDALVEDADRFVTTADLDRFEAIATPIYRSTAEAGRLSRFAVSDLGQYIVRLVAEVRRLIGERDGLLESIAELAPPDEVLVEGLFFHRDDLPRILGNFMRQSDEYARDAKKFYIERDAAIKRAEAAEAERDQALAELDDRFAESDHKAAKWYRKWREATK